MKKAPALVLAVLALLMIAQAGSAAGRNGYYRFPAIHGDTVVFTSESDLWTVDVKGGPARRLTSHPGFEAYPAISPDGQILAFSAQYEGPTEVYTMPLAGGLPERHTFAGQAATVVGWTPDGKILYATQKYSTLPNTQLVVLDPATNAESLLPLSQAADGSFDPSGRTLFFTRLPFQGSYTKRYKGGTAQNLWAYTLGAEEAVPLTTDYAGTSKNPMVWKDRIYFLSDRDGNMNIWSTDLKGGGLQQHTFHKGFDASSPSLDAGRIAYQLVADLRVFDIAAGKDTALAITLPSDFDQMRERWVTKPLDYLTSGHVSPNGDRVVLVSRGHIFVAPAGDGRWVRVDRKDGVRARAARFLGDGKSLMVLTDETGEWEFHRYAADGLGPSEQLTTGSKVIRFDGVPSPDGKWIAIADKDYQLWLFNVGKKSLSRIAVSDVGMFGDLTWSPDSAWLAYVQGASNEFSQIVLLEAETGRTAELTNDRVDSYNPAWSPDGKWLYFLSDRYFRSAVSSPWGPRQPEPYFDKTTKIYAVGLTGKDMFPFAPATELQAEKKDGADEKGPEAKTAPTAGKPAKEAEKPAPAAKTVIDLAGIQARVFEVPLPASVYSGLVVGDKTLFFIDEGSNAVGQPKLQAVEIKNRNVQAKTLMEDIRNFELSTDGKKLFVRKGNDLYVIDAGTSQPTQQTLGEKRVDLSRWTFSIDPREEWRQMFVDAWRMERDYFYDRNLHNVDYQGLLERHRPFVERVSDRSELNNLLAHLVGELSALHTFVRGGDMRQPPDSVTPGSLGARLVRDEAKGGYQDRAYLQVRSRISGQPLAAGEADVGDPRGRDHHGHQRRRDAERFRSVPSLAERGRTAGPPRGQARGRRGGPQGDRRPHHARRRIRPPLLRVGIHPAARRRERRQGPDRLRPPAGHGRRQLHGMGQEFLPGLRPPGSHHRRPPQPRRQHRLLDPRKALAQGLVLLAGPRGQADLEHAARLPRPSWSSSATSSRPRTARPSARASAGWAWASSSGRGPGAARSG